MSTGAVIVVKNRDGRPLAGVPVVPVNASTGAEGTAVNTDAQGLATFTGLADATYGFTLRNVKLDQATIFIVSTERPTFTDFTNAQHDHGDADDGGAISAASHAHAHADLTSVTANQHHNQAHAIDGADHTGTLTHAALGSVTSDQHHAKSHAHDGADGSGTVAHSATTGKTANDHHNQAHAIDGGDHTGTLTHAALSSVTADQHHAQSHVLATNLALGGDHTISGATSGHVLRASAATAAAFAQLSHADLGSVTADQHHAESHTLTSHSTRAHSELTGVGANDHHAQSHTHASHTSIGANDHHNQSHSSTDHSDYTAWGNWSPSYTGLTIGNATVVSRYAKIGKVVFGVLQIVFGSTSAWSGSFTVSLPVTAAYPSSASTEIGASFYSDAGTDRFPGIAYLASSTTMGFLTDNITLVNNTNPFTWVSGDKIDVNFMYEAA